MIKVNILTTCSQCDGQAYLPIGEVEDYQGKKYTKYKSCPHCEGTGKEPKWVSLADFLVMLRAAQYKREQASYEGEMHF